MSNTTNLVLPYLAVGQAQKHVTVNETIRKLDALVQLSVASATTTTEPPLSDDGAVWIVPSGKSGANWSAYADGALAYYRDGAWVEITPREGWIAFVKETGEVLVWNGMVWAGLAAAIGLSASDRLLGRSTAGAGAAEEIACTAAGRALIDDADAREQCATLATWQVLGQGAVAAAVTGDTSEHVLATVSIPAGAMGANGALRMSLIATNTNSANTKTLRARLGGASGTAFIQASATTNTSLVIQRAIQNRNAQNAQVAPPAGQNNSFSATSAALTTGTVDTSSVQDLVITVQLANAADTMTLESWIVELLHAA